MTSAEIKEKERSFKTQFLLMCLAVIVIVILAYFLVVAFTSKPEQPGEFGDLFGICTCVFSGLAFSGLLYTVSIQKLELRITRHELQKTAEANRASAASNQKNLEIQRLSTIIAGRQAILDILTGPNGTAQRVVFDRESYERVEHMIREYSLQIKNALNELDKINVKPE